MKSGVTMRDIAAKLNISVVTVSKALNDKDGVSDELKQKIKELAERMGYRVNAAARSMKAGYSYNIGIIVAQRFTGNKESFYMQFYKYIAQSLDNHQYSAILHILSADDEEQLVLPRSYYEKKADGYIVLGQVSKAYVEVLQNTDCALVFLDFYTDQANMDCVLTDNFYAVYEMTNYLIEQGHRRIAFVGNLHSTSSIQDRYLGYYKSMLEHRLPHTPELVINDRNEQGKFIPLELPEQLPTAFVCNCDQVAYELMQTLNRNGYRVPDDCSVVGFDNDLYSELASPKLTTVAVDREEMARTAAKIVVKKVKKSETRYGRVFVKGNLIHRESVRLLQ